MTDCSEKERFVTLEKDIKEISKRLGEGDASIALSNQTLKLILEKLTVISEQTIKTNGRVTTLETNDKTRKLVFIFSALSLFAGILIANFGILFMIEKFFSLGV